MRMPHLIICLMLAFISFSLPSCSRPPEFWKEAKPGQKRVLVTFPPLYAITHAIAGDDAYVLSMLSGQGPHGYEGDPTDNFKVNGADLLIYNGLTLDDEFVGRMLRTHHNSKLSRLNVGQVLEKKHHDLMLHDNELHDHGDGKPHKHGEHDPHIWLGPKQATVMATIIAAKLGEVDAANKAKYEKRAKEFAEKMTELQAYGEKAFKDIDKKKRAIITTHESLAYFADAFEIEIVGSFQPRPGMDADPVAMSKLSKLVKEKQVRVIAVEPQYSRAQAEALRDSLKRDKIELTIVTIDPLETAPIATGSMNPDPAFFITKMRENIDTLAKAFQ